MATKRRNGTADAGDITTQRLNIRITPEAYRRLGVHALMAGMTPGRMVESLINDHCRAWKVQANRASQVTTDDRRDLAADVSVPVSNVA